MFKTHRQNKLTELSISGHLIIAYGSAIINHLSLDGTIVESLK